MIIFFGPAGAGKSVQAQTLARSMGWTWLSAGQLLRDTQDPTLLAQMKSGELVSHQKITQIMGEAIAQNADSVHLVLDGFPRQLEQAQWLIDSRPEHGRLINLVIILDVAREEVLKRLAQRGRADDTSVAIDERLASYQREIAPILEYFAEQGIPTTHIEGSGSIEEVQARIVEDVKAHGLIV